MHSDHAHADTPDRHRHKHVANERSVALAAALTGAFMIAEVVGGLLSGSLTLLADAGHMLTDFAALALAWLGFRLTRRPADWRRTYGFDRFSVLVAFVATEPWVKAAFESLQNKSSILLGLFRFFHWVLFVARPVQ